MMQKPENTLGLPTRSRWKKRFLNLSDTFFSLFIITPLVVAHWRGTWTYMDHNATFFPPWNCLLLGSILHTAFAILREPLETEYLWKNDEKSCFKSVRRFVVTRMYTYVFSIGCIMHWRGGWAVMALHLGDHYIPALIVSVICLIPLVVLRSVRNLSAPPTYIVTDAKEFFFSFPTRFRVETFSMYKYVFDNTMSRFDNPDWNESVKAHKKTKIKSDNVP